MHRRIFFLIFLVSFFSWCHAQNTVLDSLQLELSKTTEDSTKGLLYLQMARLNVNEMDTYKSLAEKGILYCKKGGHSYGEAKGHLFVGWANQRMGHLDSSFSHFYQAEPIFSELGDSQSLSGLYIQIAGNFQFLGEMAKAVDYQKKALNITLKTGNASEKGFACIGVAGGYGRMGDFDQAMKYGVEGLRFADQTNDLELKSQVYTTLLNVYSFTGKYEEALAYGEKNLEIEKERDSKYGQQLALENIGSIYMNLDQPKKAMSKYTASLAFLDEEHNPEAASSLYSKMGESYRAIGDLDMAFDYMLKAEKLYTDMSFVEELPNLNFQLGVTEIERKNYSSALTYLNKAENYAIKANSLFTEKEIYLAKSDLYSKMGKHELALTAYQKSVSLKDSLFNIESEAAIADMKTKYDTEKKDLQIDLLQKQAEIDKRKSARQRMLIFGSLLLALLAGAVGYLKIRQNKLNQRLKMERFRNKVAADLHDDVGSTLSSISMYSEVIKQKAKDKLPETLPMLENMSTSSKELMDAMSDIVWTINPKNNSIASLLSRIKVNTAELCEAKEIQFEYIGNSFENIKVEMDVAQNVYLVLKEAINNALKYAECNKLVLEANMSDMNLNFRVTDDGNGFDVDQGTSGNGLRTMQERMHEIGGVLRFHSTNQGTEIQGEVKV